MDGLNTLDIIVLLLVGVLAVLGLVRGFVTEILSLLAWVAAVIALRLFFPAGAAMAAEFAGSDTGGAILAFVLIFFSVFILFRLIGNALGSRTKQSVIGPIDRVLGLGFGAIKGLLLASLGFATLTLTHTVLWGSGEALPAWITTARAAPLLDITSRAVIDYAKEQQGEGGLLPFPGIGRNGAAGEDGGDGYSDEQRDALDALFDEAEGTDI